MKDRLLDALVQPRRAFAWLAAVVVAGIAVLRVLRDVAEMEDQEDA